MNANRQRGQTMKAKVENSTGRHLSRSRIAVWSAAAFILLLPLIAMQLTDEVAWEVADFAIFGALLVGAGLAIELVTRKTNNAAYRAAASVALAASFIVLWVNGAVGIIQEASNEANLMYFGALAVGLIGAAIARFKPAGMARAMIATALALALVAGIALIARFGSPGEILILNTFFAALFAGSAWLFRRAARGQVESDAARPAAV